MAPLQWGIVYALAVDLIYFLGVLNSAGRNGKFARKREVAEAGEAEAEVEDVVVVTGGSSGLGSLVAEIFALKGISVAVVDVKKPQMEGNYALTYYECDVSDPAAVHRVAQQIQQDVTSLPKPLSTRCCFALGFIFGQFSDCWVVGTGDGVGELCGHDQFGGEIGGYVGEHNST